jgi:hypothetical protein
MKNRTQFDWYDTHRNGDQSIIFPPRDLKKELEKEGLSDRLVDIKHGETFFLN